MAGDLLRLAEEQADPAARVIAHRALANSQFFVGDLVATRTHAEQALAGYQAAERPELAVRYAADPFVLSAYFRPCAAPAGLSGQRPRACHQSAGPSARAGARPDHGTSAAPRLPVSSARPRGDGGAPASGSSDQRRRRAPAAVLAGAGTRLLRPGAGRVRPGGARPRRAASRIAAYRATQGILYLPYALALWGDTCRSLGEPEEGLEAVIEARRVIEATGTTASRPTSTGSKASCTGPIAIRTRPWTACTAPWRPRAASRPACRSCARRSASPICGASGQAQRSLRSGGTALWLV